MFNQSDLVDKKEIKHAIIILTDDQIIINTNKHRADYRYRFTVGYRFRRGIFFTTGFGF
jgi:hypothetical protein